VFSRFGVMFFADPVLAFRNLGDALRDGGKLGFVCWCAMAENPSFTLPLRAALPFLPEPPVPPPPDAPGPFALADAERVRGILARAGFTAIDIARQDSILSVAGGAYSSSSSASADASASLEHPRHRGEDHLLERAVDIALQIGPLGRALVSSPEGMRTRVRAAVRDAFLPHHGPSGVRLPAATWLVTARRA
jgi:hypothetical protein